MIRLKVPVDHQESVDARLEREMRLSNGQVVERAAEVASWNNELVHTREVLALEEESVKEGTILLAQLLESWIRTLKCKVCSLSRWHIDRDEQLLNLLLDRKKLGVSKISVQRYGS